ncbi:AMP-binding protein [Micromonospora chalcea]|uniref:AMP-binding protein n=1 Tax=Micromonospora chalcea TaxID=1874 RepID=UPI00382B5D80
MRNLSTWPPHPAQQGLIETHAHATGAGGANCAFAYRVTGPLQPDRLADAYRKTLAEFDALRLALKQRPEGSAWVISADVRADVTVVPAPSPDPLATVHDRVATRFRPDAGPIGAVHIQSSGPGEWVVTETFDHLIADGRALALLHERVASRYHGHAPVGPVGSYRRLLDNAAGDLPAESLAYWKRWYDGFEPVKLPPDLRPAQTVRKTLLLDPEQTTRLARAAGRCRATLAAITLAAHAHALARHTGTGDVATYLPVDTRTPEQESVFGQATILAPVRITHGWSMTAAEHSRRLTRRMFEMRPHLTVGLDVLDRAGAIQPLSDTSTSVFVFQDRPAAPPALADVAVEALNLPDLHQAGGLVTVAHRTRDGGLTIQLRTPPGSGLRQHLDSIATTVTAFLNAISEDAERRLGDDLLLPTHAAALIQQLAEPTDPYPSAPVDHALLADLSRSDRVVLVEEGTEYRAQELHSAVQARAAALRRSGVAARRAVLVDDATTFGRIASLFAVLRIGAVYVPVTAEMPPTLREHVRARTRAAASLVHGKVDLEPGTDAGAPSRTPDPDDPAYVIFTSGSTGQPKGVVISRAALANLAKGEADRFDIQPDDRVLLIAPPTTDPWICHVVGALLARATLVAADLRAALPLAEQITNHRVTHAFLPAVVFADLAGDNMPHLRMIATAGDRCRPAAVTTYLTRPGLRVFNIYGPTEATVTATAAPLTHAADPAPVGRPIRGLGARVVIDGNASAPPGVPGELMLSGIGLAIGYLDDPAGTARRFRPDPFRPGQRWYATGDRAWLGADGLLYVDGRLDRQVKIRGFRVEPGHLEAAARASRLCHDAHALAIHTSTQAADAQLRLYVTGCDSTEDLLAALRAMLPAHLLPASVITLDQLPRSGPGKVDEAQLLALGQRPPASDAEEADLSAPARWCGDAGGITELQDCPEMVGPLAAAWRRVLGAHPDPSDDFFGVGGDSLQVLRLVRELRSAGVDIAPADVYNDRSFAALANRLRQATRASANNRTPAIRMDGVLGPSQRWFFQLNLPEPNRWNQHHRIVFDRLPPADALHHALCELLRSTPILSTEISNGALRHRPETSDLALRVHADPLDDPALADLLNKLHGAMDLVRGRLLQATAIQELDGSGILLLVAHHLVVDDWSWQLIEDRIRTVLDNPGQPLPLDDGYIRFTAAVERQRVAGAFHLDVAAWQRLLEDGATTNRAHTPRSLRRISTNLAGDAKAVASRWSVPVSAVLLACLGHSLDTAQPGGMTVVDIERNGRTALPDLDLSNIVGWIALHHPLPVPHVPFSSDAATDIAALLAAIPEDGISYGALRWSGADLGSQIGRFAVNIADGEPAVSGAAAAELLGRIDRCPTSSVSAANRLPYVGSLVFRSMRDGGGFRAELTFDPDQLPEREANALLNTLSTALESAASRTRAVSTRRISNQPFDAEIPASAMQQLMLRAAAEHCGAYLPRQVIVLPALNEPPDAFLSRLSWLLGRLDPFRRRFQRTDGQMLQHLTPAAPVPIRQLVGGEQRAQTWLDEPDEIDPVAALDGGALAAFAAFTSGLDGPLLLGMQIHHAIMDGQSNQMLTALLQSLISKRQILAEVAIPAEISCSERAVRKHASAELHAVNATGFVSLPHALSESPLLPTAETAMLPAEDIAAFNAWARRHEVDLRAMFAAAALTLAYRHDRGQPVYLVSNGRTPDLPETMTALGMFWYFDPIVANTDDLVALATQVFKAASEPTMRIRARALRYWPEWSRPVGLSFNYLKARPQGANPLIRTIGYHDRFHLPHQIEVLHHPDNTSQVCWLAADRPDLPKPRLTEYLSLLRQTAQ